MEYRKYGEYLYIRMDKGDDIISGILDICRKEKISSCTFSGIGGCAKAEIQTFIPDAGEFETTVLEGMLELVNLTGNVTSDETGELYHHTHALFTYKQDEKHEIAGGHMKSIIVLYTAEITLIPVPGKGLGRKFDPVTGTGFWKFE